jgi:hypothetical protein
MVTQKQTYDIIPGTKLALALVVLLALTTAGAYMMGHRVVHGTSKNTPIWNGPENLNPSYTSDR